jgi:hypothetical protein
MPRTVLTLPAAARRARHPELGWHEYGNRVGFWRMLGCSTISHSGRLGDQRPGDRPLARSSAAATAMGVRPRLHQKNMQRSRTSATTSAGLRAIREATGKNPAAGSAPA